MSNATRTPNAAVDASTTRRPAKRIKVLTGAPDPAKLSWDESVLVSDWTPPVRRFLEGQFAGGEEEEEHGISEATAAAAAAAATGSKWRAISASRDARLHTGFTQESPLREDFWHAPFVDAEQHSFGFSSLPSDEGTPTSSRNNNDNAVISARARKPPAALSSPSLSQHQATQDADDDDADEFIEHSIAVHDDTHSSQLALDPSELELETTMLSFDHSFNTTSFSSLNDDDSSYSDLPDARLPLQITALRDIPSAAHLQRIVPQTVVVNLLVGVIAILPARAVRTRREGVLRDLFELLVGDETATGLKVSFWFAHQPEEEGKEGGPPTTKDPLREALRGLRVRDVVLVENVALDTFRDRVFGYSLRKSMQKNQTRVELLARSGVDRVAGLAGVEKVENVKEWVWRLVNPGGKGPREGGAGGGLDVGAGDVGRAQDAYLPPDTQD